MNVLAVNCGSSTLKFQLIEMEGARTLARGIVERISGPAAIEFSAEGGQVLQEAAPVADHGEATRRVLEWLGRVGFASQKGIDAAGHRVVHGGDRFVEPTLIDDKVVEAIESLGELAPLHNGPTLSAIRAARVVLGPNVPMVATFDTTFHRVMPERASRYAIPVDLAKRHRVQRYGFHGLAHRYMTERYAEVTSTPVERTKLITLQLGAGCSATAVEGGRSVDTSMGFTPLEGLVMGTRSGDVDPSLAGFLARKEGVPVEKAEGWLNTQSGLLGVSGRSQDMRVLLEAEARGETRSALAVEMFCYRARKYIGAYLAVLGGADAVVFGGGIGENAPQVRSRICDGMEWYGLILDEDRNKAAVSQEAQISSDGSRLHVYVIPVDEAAIILRDTLSCLSRSGDE
jgi:acetate kinase